MKYFETPEAKEILATHLKDAEKIGYGKALKDLDKIIVELDDQGVEVPVEVQNALEYIYTRRYE